MRTHSKTTVVELVPADVRATTYTTNDFDVSKYFGQGKVILSAEAQGSGITNTIKLQDSNLSAASTSITTDGDADWALNKSTGGKTKLAVKFTQAGARQVKYVDLQLKKIGTIASDKVLTVTIESDSSGPDGTPLGTAATVLANSIDDAYQTVRFTFAAPVSLANSTDYWIVITSDYIASDTNYIDWYVTTKTSGGKASAYGGSWSADALKNPVYTSYQYNFTDITGAAFTAVGNTASCQSLGLELDSVGSAIRTVCTVVGGSSTGAYSVTLIAPTPQQ